MDTDRPITKNMTTETENETTKLPSDYNNWSSTVIFFRENTDEVTVYAFDCDHCIMYYVVSHKRMKFLYRNLGYIAGDCKLYFVGHLIIDEETEELSYTCDVHVYDIPSRQWIQDFPKLKYQKRAPFVFFLDGKLYVLSSGSPYIPLSHFEMLDINNLSQGWVSLSEPTSLVYQNLLACHHAKIIDHSNKMLYVKLLDGCCTDIYGYSVDHKEWHTSALDRQTLPYRSRNLFKASWSKHCVIVEDHLYRFQMFQYSNGPPRAILVLCDLGHKIERLYSYSVERIYADDIHSDDDPPIPGQCHVDISNIVDPLVLKDSTAVGYLVSLGRRNSRLRFFLAIMYNCKPCSKPDEGHIYHLSTCTFELTPSSRRESSTESFIAKRISYNSPHIEVDPSYHAFNKLCEVKDD